MDPRKIKDKYHLFFFSEVATSENTRDIVNFTPSHADFPFRFHVVLYCP